MATAKIDVKTDLHGSGKKLKDTGKALTGMAGTAEKAGKKTSALWKQFAGGAIAVGILRKALSGTVGLTKSFLDVGIRVEKYQIQLKTLLGSQEKATEAFEFFSEVASELPFTLDEVIESGTRLAAIRAPFEKWLPRIADLASAIGFDLPTATDQMARAMASGLGSADLFREKGVSAMIRDFAKLELGIEDVSKLALPDLQDVLFRFTGQFSGASEEMAKSWGGLTSMISDAWFQFQQAVMDAGVFDFLKEKLSGFLDKIEELKESGKLAEWAEQTAEAVVGLFNVIEDIASVALPLMGEALKGVSWWSERVRDVSYGVQQAWLATKFSGEELAQKTWELFASMHGLNIEVAKGDRKLEEFSSSEEEAAEKTGELESKTTELIPSIWGVGNAIDKKLIPALDKIEIPDAVPEFKPIIERLIPAFGNLTSGVVDLGNEIPKTANKWPLLEEKATPVIEEIDEGWKEMSDQIKARWIEAISDVITQSKTLDDAMKGLTDALFKMFADTFAKMVIEGEVSAKQIFTAFRLWVGSKLVEHLAIQFGLIEDEMDVMAQNMQAAAKETGEVIRDSITKPILQAGDAIQATGDDIKGFRGGGDELTNAMAALENALLKIGDGTRSAVEQSQALETAWSTLIDVVKDFGLEGSQAFIDLIIKTREAGVEVKALAGFINDQLGVVEAGSMSAADGLQAMAEHIPVERVAELKAEQTGLTEEMAKIQKSIDDYKSLAANTELTAEETQALNSQITQAQQEYNNLANQAEATGHEILQVSVTAEEAATQLESQAMTVFNSMIANGASYNEAMESIGPTLDIIAQAHEDMGTEGGIAIQELLHIRDVTEANESLFNAIDGNLAVLTALKNTANLSEEALLDSANQASDFYDEIVAAGLTGDQALAQMAPTLQLLAEESDKYGITLDDNTQKLIDQAKDMGLVTEAQETEQEQQERNFDELGDRMAEIMDAVGDKISEAIASGFKGGFDDGEEKSKTTGSEIADEMATLGTNIDTSISDGFNDGFADAETSATETKGVIDTEFSGMNFDVGIGFQYDDFEPPIPAENIRVGIEYDYPENGGTGGDRGEAGGNIGGFADGGIAMNRQLAFVAERGPEAMIPVDQLLDAISNKGNNGNINITLQIDGQRLTEFLSPHIEEQAKLGTIQFEQVGIVRSET